MLYNVVLVSRYFEHEFTMPDVDREYCLCDVVYRSSRLAPNLELAPRADWAALLAFGKVW